MKLINRFLITGMLWLCCSQPIFASITSMEECKSSAQVSGSALKVAIRPAPPYIQEHAIRGLEGVSIDLWQRVAKELSLDYSYVCLDLNDTLDALKSGQIDLAISPLTISRDREKVFDFSHQYFSSSLVLATRPEAVSFDFSQVLQTLFKLLTSSAFIGVLLIFICLTLLLAIIAHRNKEQYTTLSKDEVGGRFSFSLHLLLMSGLNTVGMRKDIFSFRNVRVQLLFLFVLFMGTLFSSSFGGIITAAFMSSTQQSHSIDENYLYEYRISTLKGSTAERYLNEKLAEAQMLDTQWLRRDTWQEVLIDLVEGKADVVIGDWVQLTYLANQGRFKGKVQVNPKTLRMEPHGWGLPAGSPLREPVDQELIGVLRNDHWPDVVRGYLGGDQLSAN